MSSLPTGPGYEAVVFTYEAVVFTDDGVAFMPKIRQADVLARAQKPARPSAPPPRWDDLAVTWGAVCAIGDAIDRWLAWERSQ